MQSTEELASFKPVNFGSQGHEQVVYGLSVNTGNSPSECCSVMCEPQALIDLLGMREAVRKAESWRKMAVCRHDGVMPSIQDQFLNMLDLSF